MSGFFIISGPKKTPSPNLGEWLPDGLYNEKYFSFSLTATELSPTWWAFGRN
jgi:hypothetical protein